MVFHVIIGGILLSRRQCYEIAAVATALFALLAFAEWSGVLHHYSLAFVPHAEVRGELVHAARESVYVFSSVLTLSVTLFLTAYFVTTLAERTRENERGLQAMAQRAMAARQLLERALETTQTGLRVLGVDLRSFWANNRWGEWFPDRQEADARAPALLESPDSPASLSLGDGRIRVTELILGSDSRPVSEFHSTSNHRAFQITSAPLTDTEGKIVQVAELAQDITAQKRAQAQIIHAGKLAAAGELAGHVAHEVNNPIAIIIAKSRLLLSDHGQEMSPKVALELGKISDCADRVARIAQGLLSSCRPSGSARMRLDVRVPIRRCLAMVDQHARSGGVQIEDRLPPSPLEIRANASELEQVFLNLFLNAMDAMPRGGRLRLSVESEASRDSRERSTLVVLVEDTGCGISEAVRERMFEPFFTTKTEGRGTGLGLSICLGLLRGHGGDMEVDSEPGRGTRIRVMLPIQEPLRRETQ